MPDFTVLYRPEVYGEDFPQIPRNLHSRILRAVEKRLMTNPIRYGTRLRQSLMGLWKLRVGDYRVIFEIQGDTVTVWAIRHRKNVYEEAQRRWSHE